jgi:hypothetical protein
MNRLALLACLVLARAANAQFIVPPTSNDPPIYGIQNGIAIAFHPAALDSRPQGGPRGLIRIGYHEDNRFHLINYLAVEPLVGKVRGFSELEKSGDGKPGKRMTLRSVQKSPQTRSLTLLVEVEAFANGAKPNLEIALFEDSPQRMRLRTFAAPESKTLNQCVLTATMGNQSRCRWLWIDPKPVFALTLYRNYAGNGFVEGDLYPLHQLHRTKSGDVVAAISPDEAEPSKGAPRAGEPWHHDGKWMAQYWLKPAGSFDESLQCRVNGRRVYWGGETPIPGGIAFENFELRETYRPGAEVWFGYTTRSPADAFGFDYDVAPGSDAITRPATQP